jgi:hypothetical protein
MKDSVYVRGFLRVDFSHFVAGERTLTAEAQRTQRLRRDLTTASLTERYSRSKSLDRASLIWQTWFQ